MKEIKKANIELRNEVRKNRLSWWMVAESAGVSESQMSRILRHELSESEKEKYLAIISELAKEAGK